MKRIFRLASPLLLAAALPVQAADLRVTTFADEYDGECTRTHCSLREAVSAANALGQARIILQAGEYRLGRPNLQDEEGEINDEDDNLVGDLDVTGELSIIGKGSQLTVLHGASLDRLIEVFPEARLTLRDLAITGGRTPHRGAGLENRGSTELLRVRLVDNVAASAFIRGQGGGVSNSGSMLIRDSQILNNRAHGSEGALGSGGGIYNTGALWVRDSRIGASRCGDDNDSGEGCGLYNEGLAEIARSVLDDNQSAVLGTGAAILNRGQLRLSNSTISGNGGSENGAALHNGGGWRVDNSLVSAELMHVTVAGNQVRGITNEAKLTLRNSVLAGNTLNEQTANCLLLGGNALYQARGLLMGNDASNCTADIYFPDSATFTRHLFPLAENNGTLLHSLRHSSAAIDAGVGTCASHDQRGLDRQRDGNGDGIINCDLGAFERARP